MWDKNNSTLLQTDQTHASSPSRLSVNASDIKTGSTNIIVALLEGLAWNTIYEPLRLRKKNTPASSYSKKLMPVGYTNSTAASWAINSAGAGAGLYLWYFPKYHTFLNTSQPPAASPAGCLH